VPGCGVSHLKDWWDIAEIRAMGPSGDSADAGAGGSDAKNYGPTGDVVLASLLNRFPRAMVSAISESGLAIPVPDEVPLGEHRSLESTFDAVIPADRVVIVDLYARARTSGLASAPVHVIEDPGRAVTVYVVDGRTNYGVLIVVFGDALDDTTGISEEWALPQLPPRLARAYKDGSAVYVAVDPALTEILGWPMISSSVGGLLRSSIRTTATRP